MDSPLRTYDFGLTPANPHYAERTAPLVYIIGSAENKSQLQCLFHYLQSALQITLLAPQWLQLPPESKGFDRCRLDFADLDRAKAVIATIPYGENSLTEIGYAIGKRKPTAWFLSDYAQDAWDEDYGVNLYHHPKLYITDSIDFLVHWLDKVVSSNE